MRPTAFLLTSLPLALAFSLTSPARAQADAASRALAVQLFDEAEALFAKGEVAPACPKYAESYRLDPQLGVLIYLAECYEKNGQLASAWGSFREADEMARKRGDARGELARKRAAALEPRLSYLVVRVPKAARVKGLEVLRAGVPLTEVLWGSRAAVDPGKQRIEARAPGYRPWHTEVDVSREGSAAELEIPVLQRAPSSKASSNPMAPSTPPGSSGGSQRIAAIAVGGLGVVGIGVGGFFGLGAQAAQSDSEPLCNDDDFCTLRGHELRDSAKDKALIATISGSVGAAALVTAAVLWFTAPSGEPRTEAKRQRTWALGPSSASWGLEVNHAF